MYSGAMNPAIMKPLGKTKKFAFARMKHTRQKNCPQIKYFFPKLGYINLRALPCRNLTVCSSHTARSALLLVVSVCAPERPNCVQRIQDSLPSLHVFSPGCGTLSMSERAGEVQLLLLLTRLSQTAAPGCSSAVHKTAALCQSS